MQCERIKGINESSDSKFTLLFSGSKKYIWKKIVFP
jgi:hypothetical protein